MPSAATTDLSPKSAYRRLQSDTGIKLCVKRWRTLPTRFAEKCVIDAAFAMTKSWDAQRGGDAENEITKHGTAMAIADRHGLHLPICSQVR